MHKTAKVYEHLPEGFSARVEIAAVYVNVDGRILFLEIAHHKEEKGAWGVPAGKLEANEEPLQAAQRELFEETGISVKLDAFHTLGQLYVRKPGLDYVYHLFSLNLDVIPSLSLSSEHSSYVWASREEAHTLPLMDGARDALDVYFQRCFK